MKLLSIAIPCYNSEAYMENCIKSLLPGGDEVEILVIDDGSKKAQKAGVHILAYDCLVEPDRMEIQDPVPICLEETK